MTKHHLDGTRRSLPLQISLAMSVAITSGQWPPALPGRTIIAAPAGAAGEVRAESAAVTGVVPLINPAIPSEAQAGGTAANEARAGDAVLADRGQRATNRAVVGNSKVPVESGATAAPAQSVIASAVVASGSAASTAATAAAASAGAAIAAASAASAATSTAKPITDAIQVRAHAAQANGTPRKIAAPIPPERRAAPVASAAPVRK